MIEKAKNKAIGSSEVPEVTVTAESRYQNRFHFAGDGVYQPMSVVATNIEDATDLWKQKRVPLEPAQPEAKVAESNEPINSNE